MQLGGYAASRQLTVWPWVVVLLGLAWGCGVISDFDGADEYGFEGADEIYLLYVDRELRMLDGAAGSSGLMRWYFEVDEEEDMIRDLLRTLDEGVENGIIGGEAQRARAVLHWRQGAKDEALAGLEKGWDREKPLCRILRALMRGAPVVDQDVGDLVNDLSERRGYAWEVWGLRLALEDTGMSADEVTGAYDQTSRGLARRVFWALGGTYLLVAVGLICVPMVWRRSRSMPAPREHRVVALWSAPLVLAVFFYSELFGDFAASAMGMFFVMLNDWSIGWDLVYDIVWRVAPVVMMTLLMFSRPSHMVRVFGVARPGHWGAALAVLAVLWAGSWVSYLFTGGDELLPVQPTDFIYAADPTWVELAADFFSSCVTAPIVEEIMFRGLLFLGLKRAIGPWAALVVSSFFFGVVHWQYDVLGVLSVMLLGAANAVLVWRTGSLFPAIVVHAMHNFLISLMVLVAYQMPL